MSLRTDVQIINGEAIFRLATTDVAVQFFLEAWRTRASLTEAAKRGLCQYGYTTLASHFEGFLIQVITGRLSAISGTVLHPVMGMSQEQQAALPTEPRESTPHERLHASLLEFFEDAIDDLSGATFNSLARIFERLYSIKLPEVLGSDLLDIVRALYELRNVVAHGRAVSVHQKWSCDEQATLGPYLEAGNLNRVRKVLLKGRIVDANPEMAAYLPQRVFDETALLFFWKSIREAQGKIDARRDATIEASFAGTLGSLPEL